MAYDRDEFIRLLTDYYEFCNRIFWKATVRQAPPGGWPSINHESIAGLAKNDTVIDLLRHLPYVDYSEQDLYFMPIILDETPIVDYRREDLQQLVRDGKIEGYVEPNNGGNPPIPPSCACIATCLGRKGYYVVVDTDDGYVYWGDPNGQHDEPPTELNDVLDRYEGDSANYWRNSGVNVYRPADFFSLCKQRFRELRWVGLGQWQMSAMRMGDEWDEVDEDHLDLVEKMRAAGWPGDGEGGGWDRARFEAEVYTDD
ncbi:uncharacterized protein CTRU02_210291 [Colletotrichum truncatum]|uniref:Uncharacterized protein n=1 Tax=Colletotrichum truncatum TaxID=5467 RepID=A0ACC3YUW1_COLTU|nr:uncharacterized protein CTRU02_11504 [Colletotrichum truncatum]KAF6785879.1 hypothetical protein CTRU02_11504 [Colletotrichum truncatum]